MEEKQALLFKEQINKTSSQKPKYYSYNEDDGSSSEGSEEWWEESASSCSSCESHSESSFKWEGEINENGELFYIESDPPEEGSLEEDQKSTSEDKITQVENVKGGRLVSWMRRRDGKKLHLNLSHSPKSPSSPVQSVNNKKENEAEYKDIILKLENIRQGAALSEKLLGLSLSSTTENKIVISKIDPDGPTYNHKELSTGDTLQMINNHSVTPVTVDNILGSLSVPGEVILKIQKANLIQKKYQSSFVKQLLEKHEGLESVLLSQAVGIVVVDIESQNLNKDDVIYSFPEKCVLSSCRGAFITLFHLLSEINANYECQSSSVMIKNQPTHVLYKSENNYLFLMAVPQVRCSLKEAAYILEDLLRTLLFSYQTLKRCFEATEKASLNHFFSLFFCRLLTNGFSSEASRFVALENIPVMSSEDGSPQFEDILPFATWVPLPKEAQVQIDDALNELEANDLDHEEEESVENQRLFNIIGSCVFHKGFLLVSHLPKEDLLDIISFYRQNCLIQLFRKEPVRSLIIWKEVFPNSVNRGLPIRKEASYPMPVGRWFLLIVGQGYDSISVILESGGCCTKIDGNPGPAVAYVEETEETLRHLQKLGISSLASQWIENNNRFKTITPEEVFYKKSIRKKDNLLGFVKSADGSAKFLGANTSPASSNSSDTSPAKRNRVIQQETSEDSVSQTPSNVSEVSDENVPILGRRGERGQPLTNHNSDSDSSDSDWVSSRDSNMRASTCSSVMDNFYHGDIGEIIPAKLTTGPDNLLFHYVHLDGNEGVIVTPTPNSKRSTPKMKEILDNFRRCALIIHSIFENSIRFKKNGQDSSVNKSLVAVKEHGVLFQSFASESDSNKKSISFNYWVVGRLFFTPQPREVYVCYYEDAPQNLVELAFRLGLSAAG